MGPSMHTRGGGVVISSIEYMASDSRSKNQQIAPDVEMVSMQSSASEHI